MLRPARMSLAATLALLAGCRDRLMDPGLPGVLRLGYLPNVTHAQALTGVSSGRYAAALGQGVRLEPKVFPSGPAVVEALFAGEIDAAYLGPSPAITGFVRSGGRALRIVAGAATGGARLVVRRQAGIGSVRDLPGKRIGTPQIGNTQDVALRTWLQENGLETTDRGGTVSVYPLAPADILALLARGELDGAWVAEPWPSRLLAETPSVTLLDDRDLWPDRPVTVLCARAAFLEVHPHLVALLLRAHAAETVWHAEHATDALDAMQVALQALTGKRLEDAVLAEALAHVTLVTTVGAAPLRTLAQSAKDLGYIPSDDVEGILAPGSEVPR